ncbi:sensor domain-containing diguanylate cyclase [Mesorhizobium helmanticense]|uniref:diguanylate cyclase n=1 Tax=Mesorhizobium helmanticense TaxID=1776423 RepID=A0A2T4IX65_9HYPH|nr:sensor domain-containing diguanylate cyclase [Mesorhizobium helmanticense]PTE10212.1 sensor domain-containing diguanylate cyclase [Mesorhizobium helmanticense]
MQTAADLREAARLQALDRFDILDTPREASFDRITRLIRTVLDVPIAIVSVIDRHRQWYKACEGLSTGEAERKDTFCRHTVLMDGPLIVRDATKDPRFADNPHVRNDPHIRFYAGVPLRTRDGHNIGSVCAIGYKPREFGSLETAILQDFSDLVMDQLEMRQHASSDALTGVLSRRAFMEQGRRAFALAKRQRFDLSCIVFDVDHFKSVNDTFGHAVGDEVLSGVARRCGAALRDVDIFGRVGGEEFAILMYSSRKGALESAERLRGAIEAMKLAHGTVEIAVTASLGVAPLDSTISSLHDLIERADTAMYSSKHAGRNRTTVWNSLANDEARPRRRVLKAGQIVFNARMSTIDCTVRSLGEDGATIDVSNIAGIPEQFLLVIRADKFETKCRVVSQKERRLELSFD